MMKEQQNNTSGIQDMPQAREQDLLKDPRIKTLIDDFGMAGFGAYCLLRNHLAAYAQNGLPMEYLLRFGREFFPFKRIKSILKNYQLFNINQFMLVTLNDVPHTCTDGHDSPHTCTDGHDSPHACIDGHDSPHACTDGHDGRNTPENLNINQEKIKTKNIGCWGENEEVEERVKTQKFKKPTVEEVAEYCRQRANSVNPERFCSFYESKGWKIGKNSMKDWKAAVRTWEQDENRGIKAEHAKQPTEPSAPKSLAVYDDNGIQFFEGRPLPPDAPPRPSESALWDDSTNSWLEFYS